MTADARLLKWTEHQQTWYWLCNLCRPLEIDASISERPGLLLKWNSAVPLTITKPESPAGYGIFPPAHLKPCHNNVWDAICSRERSSTPVRFIEQALYRWAAGTFNPSVQPAVFVSLERWLSVMIYEKVQAKNSLKTKTFHSAAVPK